MVTSTQNPKQQTFIHVNGIIYRSNDVIELGNGSIFIPISREEIVRGEKKLEDILDSSKAIDLDNCLSDFRVYRLFVKNSMNIHLI